MMEADGSALPEVCGLDGPWGMQDIQVVTLATSAPDEAGLDEAGQDEAGQDEAGQGGEGQGGEGQGREECGDGPGLPAAEQRLAIELGGERYVLDGAEGAPGAIALSDATGITVFTDSDGDGLVDRLETVRFDGSFEAWRRESPSPGGTGFAERPSAELREGGSALGGLAGTAVDTAAGEAERWVQRKLGWLTDT